MGAVGVAHALVEADGTGIFGCDDGVIEPVALAPEDLFSGGIEAAADSPALGPGQQIDGKLRAPAVSCPGIRGAAVDIAQYFARFFPYKPGKLGGNQAEPVQKFCFRGNGVFESIGGV